MTISIQVPCDGVFVVILFKTMYNKTIIRFGFSDILNNWGLCKCYHPRPLAWLITLTLALFIPDVTKTSSNNNVYEYILKQWIVFFSHSDWLLNQWISCTIHWFTSSSSERVAAVTNKEISQLIKQAVPEVYEEVDEVRFGSFKR